MVVATESGAGGIEYDDEEPELEGAAGTRAEIRVSSGATCPAPTAAPPAALPSPSPIDALFSAVASLPSVLAPVTGCTEPSRRSSDCRWGRSLKGVIAPNASDFLRVMVPRMIACTQPHYINRGKCSSDMMSL